MLAQVDWPAFLFAMFVVELTPGPNMGWLTMVSANRGRAFGMQAVAGITLGLFLQILAAATGLSSLMAASHLVYEGLRWAGVAFMVFLAWEAFRDDGSAVPAQGSGFTGFRRGLIANLLNPKALVFYLVIVGQFASPEAGHLWVQIFALGMIHLVVSILIHSGLVLIGDGFGTWVERWGKSIYVRSAFAIALLTIALWIALSTGRG
ncbi:MAG: LysE family translocator [Hyphomonas sp.]|nr:LysE family translocator [Hyphomonas sp.]